MLRVRGGKVLRGKKSRFPVGITSPLTRDVDEATFVERGLWTADSEPTDSKKLAFFGHCYFWVKYSTEVGELSVRWACIGVRQVQLCTLGSCRKLHCIHFVLLQGVNYRGSSRTSSQSFAGLLYAGPLHKTFCWKKAYSLSLSLSLALVTTASPVKGTSLLKRCFVQESCFFWKKVEEIKIKTWNCGLHFKILHSFIFMILLVSVMVSNETKFRGFFLSQNLKQIWLLLMLVFLKQDPNTKKECQSR